MSSSANAARSRAITHTRRHFEWGLNYIADLYMESREEFEALLASPEGQAAIADVPRYATGGVQFIYTEVQDVI